MLDLEMACTFRCEDGEVYRYIRCRYSCLYTVFYPHYQTFFSLFLTNPNSHQYNEDNQRFPG